MNLISQSQVGPCAALHRTTESSRQRVHPGCILTSRVGRRNDFNTRNRSYQRTADVANGSNVTSSSTPGTSTGWTQRMASVQGLMARAQQQLQNLTTLEASKPEVAKQLKLKAEDHLDMLMQLAEAEQKHITGHLPPEQLQQLLNDMQQQLDNEQEEVLAEQTLIDSNSNNSAVQAQDEAILQKQSELLGSNEELRKAVGHAVAELKQQQPVSSARLQEKLAETQAQLEAAEAALQDSQQLRMEYDLMCQQSYELSRKLSLSESHRTELQRELENMKQQLALAAEELSEHRELQMQHDKLCQDMYRMRMMLQQAQSHANEVAQDAAASTNKHKQDVNWLMEAHRRELADMHSKNQELTQDTQKLRMRLLEVEERLWGQHTPAPVPAASTADDTAALIEQQKQQLEMLQQTSKHLTAEKQQLMKSLQEMQRQQAVLLVELQHVREQAKQADEAANAAAVTVSTAVPVGPSEAELQLVRKLEDAEQQRSSLIQQVQQLQQSLQESREAAAAAAEAGRKAAAAAVPVSRGAGNDTKLAEVKAEIIQLRGQLGATRRELHLVTGQAQAAEAALKQQAADYEARLAQLQSWYGKQVAVVAQLRKGKSPVDGSVGFTNTNRFWVGQESVFDFLKQWVAREALLQQQPGFLGLQVTPVPGVSADGGVDVRISSFWESIPLYESWRNSPAAIQHHLPNGVYQYVPKRGEGFPEDFIPFRDYDEAVNAKY